MDKKLYLSSKILSVIGMLIAAYMTVYKITSNDGMCLGSGDCSTVNASKYSSLYGIPVGLIGLLGYIVIFLLLQFEGKNDLIQRYGMIALFGITLVGFFFTLYLIYIELFVIDAICPFCLGSQVTMTLIFILTSTRLFKQL